MRKLIVESTRNLVEHPDYERVLLEVITGRYKVELFDLVSKEAKDEIHAQALYIKARLGEK